MKKVSIVVLEGGTPIAPVGAMEILNKAGVIHQNMHNTPQPFFTVELVGVHSTRIPTTPTFSIDCHTTINQISRTDVLLIPPVEHNIEERIARSGVLSRHVRRLHAQGCEVGSMCTGAFFLAATGLLDGKRATTHWFFADRFKKLFPDVVLEDNRIVIDAGGTYTSGGASSFLNLCLYLVEKFCGAETATLTSKMLLLDFKKANQSNYAIFYPQMQHNDDAIKKAQDIIESEKGNLLRIDEISHKIGLSKRSFIRRFKAATGNAPNEYIKRVNVEKAKKQLEISSSTVEQIVFDLGYNDINSFRNQFKKVTGMNPSEYRKKYKRALD